MAIFTTNGNQVLTNEYKWFESYLG